jgi:hypothetical protein
MQATALGNRMQSLTFLGNAIFFLKMSCRLLLLKKASPNLLLLTDLPKGENGLWVPLDILKCTSSANEDTIFDPDGWGPNFGIALSASFPSVSLSLPVFISGSILSPVRASVPFLSHILLT